VKEVAIYVILQEIAYGWGTQHAWERWMHTRFWSENLKGRDHSEDLGTDRKIIEQILWN